MEARKASCPSSRATSLSIEMSSTYSCTHLSSQSRLWWSEIQHIHNNSCYHPAERSRDQSVMQVTILLNPSMSPYSGSPDTATTYLVRCGMNEALGMWDVSGKFRTSVFFTTDRDSLAQGIRLIATTDICDRSRPRQAICATRAKTAESCGLKKCKICEKGLQDQR